MFDGRKFLDENFHTPHHALTILRQYGFEATLGAIEKWWQRESVPGAWLPLLIAIKEIETGSPVSITKYVRRGD